MYFCGIFVITSLGVNQKSMECIMQIKLEFRTWKILKFAVRMFEVTRCKIKSISS